MPGPLTTEKPRRYDFASDNCSGICPQAWAAMDGARLANAVVSLNVAPKEVTWKAGVDVLCLGGTKNGIAVGDCVVLFNRDLAEEFAYQCKQAGQLASKMRYLSAPWVGLLKNGAWLDNARQANRMAQRLQVKLRELPGVEILNPIEANAVFARFPDTVADSLRADGWQFYDRVVSRLMCSWSTTEQAVDDFCNAVRRFVDDAAA